MRRFKINLFISVFLLLIFACSPGKQKQKNKTNQTELSEFEEQELLAQKKNKEESLYHYPKIISQSLNGLSLIKNDWKSSSLLCSETEKFVLVRKVESNRLLAVSYAESREGYTFFLYDLYSTGEILGKSIMKNADFYIDNRHNFQVFENKVYYFKNKAENKEYYYDLENSDHGVSKNNRLNWAMIDDWRSHSFYTSPNNELTVEITDVQLILENAKAPIKDTLISQKYDGTWSFGSGFWNSNSSKFYFDNSGAVACIWELDVKNKTLDKIIPDHWAKAPILLSDSITTEIVYCEKGCLKKAEFENTNH